MRKPRSGYFAPISANNEALHATEAMNLKLLLKLLLYFLILVVMSLNGAWLVALFLSPPKRAIGLGIWYWLYFMIVPALAFLGITALALKKPLKLSWRVGGLLLLYVGSLTVVPVFFAPVIIFFFSESGLGFFNLLMFTITLIQLLITLFRR